MSHLKALAQRFVEDDLSLEEQQLVVTQAADYVASEGKLPNDGNGAPAIQLALSIQRWMSKDDPDDHVGDVEKNAKAHSFVARTLKALPQDTLTAKEVQVFAGFFGSMYSIGGNSWPVATEALATLVAMDSCNTSAVDAILSNMADIDPDDFTKQLAKTRLELFQFFGQLLGAGISKPRQKRQSLPKILKLAVRERDPNNLLFWFRTLSSIVRATDLTQETADALFDSLSPFFPISIRASTSNTNMVSEQDLKDALRSCFAANGQLARHVMPFVLGKLDDGTSSMTVSVKLDILGTIEACVLGYVSCDTQVLPYVSQIWSSLKYEVRNGEAPEAIQATLSVFETISKRLANDSTPADLAAFIETIWSDSIEDLLDNPAYTEQLGSILISVARAHLASFRLISPRLSQAVQRAMHHPKSSAHTKSLLLVLNNLLRVRRQLASSLSATSPAATYEDGSVSLLRGVFFKILNENAVGGPSAQQTDLAKEALIGLEQIVRQRRLKDDGVGFSTDCNEEALKEICSTLAFHHLNCFNRRPADAGSTQEAFESAVGEALLAAVQNYPQGYGEIVSDVLDDVKKTNWNGSPAKRSLVSLRVSCMRLAYLGCAAVPDSASAIVNFSCFAGSMLKILGGLFESKASFAACAIVAAAILKGVHIFVTVREIRSCLDILKHSDVWERTWDVSSINDAVTAMLPTFPDLAAGRYNEFDPSSSVQVLPKARNLGLDNSVLSFLQLGIFIVRQLYQHATARVETSDPPGLDLSISMTTGLVAADGQALSSAIIWRDRYLHMIGSVAAAVLRELNTSAQMDMKLDKQLLACFRSLHGMHISWGYHRCALLGELSWGIAHAIRPEVVLHLHGDIVGLLNVEAEEPSSSSSQPSSRITTIATLLANKYDSRAPTPVNEGPSNHENWILVLAKIEELLRNPGKLASMPEESLSTLTGILWGATSRGDKFVTKGLQESLCHAAATSNDVARVLARIFLPLERFLCPDYTPAYLISKPLSRQRAYYHCVRPVLSNVYPLSGETEESVSMAIYTLHAVKQLNVAQYEHDSDKIFRIALTAVTKANYVEDVDAAATIVYHIISKRTTLAKQHLNAILDAERAMYNNAHPFQKAPHLGATNPSSNPWARNFSIRTETEADRTELRKKALRLSGLVAQKMDGSGSSPSLLRSRSMVADELMHLTPASGDKIREIRALVLKTRGQWLSIENSTAPGEE